MIILVDRFISDNDSTISKIYIDNKFQCFGLEDEYRAVKLVKETRIPSGLYEVKVNKDVGKNIKYNERFPDIHRGMLQIDNVPGFTFVLIHCGNTEADTEGCLLVGSGAITEAGHMSVSGSGAAYVRFYSAVIDAAAAKQLVIKLIDNDGH